MRNDRSNSPKKEYDLTLSDSLVHENVFAVMYFLTCKMPIMINMILQIKTINIGRVTCEVWYFVTYCEKKLLSDREKLLKFEVEG